jgi:hypothetical protein
MRGKDEFDAEDIGALAVPPPTLTDLATDITHGYAFLRDLDDERAVATCPVLTRPRSSDHATQRHQSCAPGIDRRPRTPRHRRQQVQNSRCRRAGADDHPGSE